MDQPKVCIDKADLLPEGTVERMALLRRSLWVQVGKRPGSQPLPLRIAFLGGSKALQARVEEVASEWMRHAHVKFQFGVRAEGAEIRIAFMAGKGSWSYLGRDALAIKDEAMPTMNYGWLTDDSPMKEVRRVVLHEFGHALGCLHEHQSPAAGIPWNRKKVYDYYEEDGCSKEWVDINIFKRYSKTQTVHSVFDPESIMLYPVDPKLTDGKYSAGENTELSEQDKAFIASVYPRP